MNTTSRIVLSLCAVFTLMVAVAPAEAADTAALFRESYRLEAVGDAPGALRQMQAIKKSTGETYFVMARIAWLSYLAGRYEASVVAYKMAISAVPKSVEPKIGLTAPLLAQSNWRELERACREVLKLDPRNEIARARLAIALYSIGNYPDCAVAYRNLTTDYPANLNYQTGLAWAVLKMGRRAEATKIFNQVLAVSPDNPHALAGVAGP